MRNDHATQRRRAQWLWWASPAILATALFAPNTGRAQATAASAAAKDEVEAVVVTAQRRAERLQDVPISISAFATEEIEGRQVGDVKDLQGLVPGFTVSGFAASTNSGIIALRGIGGISLPFGSSSATAVYLDGIYLSRPDAGYFTLDDVERIEVLRGPQGTLYGRNATAGAINIITRQPGDQFHVGAQARYANFDTVEVLGSVSGPIADGLAIGLSAARVHRGEWLTNLATGHKVGGDDSATVRAKLRFERGKFEALFAADYAKMEFFDTLTQLQLGGRFVGIGDGNTFATDFEDFINTHQTSKGVGLTMNLELLENLTLTAVTGYRKERSLVRIDLDATAAPGGLLNQSLNRREVFYQEFRGLFTTPRFRLTAGGNYYHEDGDFQDAVFPTPASPNVPSPFDTSKMEAVAAFGQAELDLTDDLTLVGGLRYNHETRDFVVAYPAAGVRRSGTVSDGALLPALGLNFKPTPTALLYVKMSQGYQAPGFNARPGATYPANLSVTFGPETLKAYEAGAKTEWFDRRVILNGAVFYYDYKDLQVRTLTEGTNLSISNAASATNKGFELELTVRPLAGLTLNGQVTYTKAVFKRFCDPVAIGSPLYHDPACSTTPAVLANRKGNSLPFAPRWLGGVSADYERPLSDNITLHLNAAYTYVGNRYFSTANEPVISTLGAVEKVDVRAALEFANGSEVYVFGKNISDTQFPDYVARITPTSILGNISEPRAYGIGVKYRY